MDSSTADDKLPNALESGDFQTALPLLPKDGPLITIGPEGFTPLHYACRHGEAEVTRLLITQYHYGIKSTSIHGQTPAHIAAKYGHVDTLRALVECTSSCGCGNDTDTSTPATVSDTSTATSTPATVSDISSFRDQQGNTPLHTATVWGQLPVVQYLIHDLQFSPACINLNSETPLHLTAKNGNLDVMKYLVNEVGCPTSPVDKYGGTPLYTAAGHGQIKVVQYLVEEKGHDPNVRITKRWDKEFKEVMPTFAPGRTLLHTASQEGHLNIVQYLVNEIKCYPSCRDEDGVTPLYLASQQGHLAILKFLVIECECDPNVARNDGRTPLHGACWGGSLEIVQYLVNEHQVDTLSTSEAGNTPLHSASTKGHLAVVRFLTEKGCDPLARNKNGNTPVSFAALNGRLDILKFFITEKGCVPMVRGQWNRTLVHSASQEGHLETVQYLINEHQVDPSCQNESSVTPLHLASMNGYLAVVRFLIEKGCDPLARNKDGNTSVSYAALSGRLDVLKFFITENGYDPMGRDRWGQTLLHHASRNGHLETMQYLIEEVQLNPSCQDEDNDTPLHIASENGDLPIVQFLTDRGSDPFISNIFGKTPVSIASVNGRLDVLKLLTETVVSENTKKTVLHIASREGHLEMVQYFIGVKKWDPLISDQQGRTPLHVASANSHLKIVEYLINEQMVDPSCQSNRGITPLHLASMNGHLEVVKYLVEKALCDPSVMTSDTQRSTPMTLACRHHHGDVVLYLYSKGEYLPKGYSTPKPPLENRVRIYCIGNRAIGKSTLLKALSAEAAWFGGLRNVSDVAPETAGIVPFEFDSGIYGKITFYDFAGHKEYYASHEVVFDKDSHPVILLTVNVSEDDDTIRSSLRFWRHFLANVVSSSDCQAHIIIIGSHVDHVSPQHQSKQSIIVDNFKSSSLLTVVDSVLLDCRKSSSKGMSKLRQSLKATCKTARIRSKVDFYKGGILSEFMRGELHKENVLTFIDLYSRVLNTPGADLEPLMSPEALLRTCESLSVSGHILLLGNREVPEESWVVLQKEVILSRVHGLLKHMKLTTELGIVPLSLIESLLQKHVQDLPSDLAIRYMKKMVFCSDIDPQALACIRNFPHESVDANEKYFFFSSLVRIEKPNQVLDWNPEQLPTYTSGWYLKCTNPDHFFTPRFLQELLIELACQFALKVNPNSPGIFEAKQGCNMWKNGLSWLDPRGIEVVAEVDEIGKSLCMTLKSFKEVKLHCVKLRSELIHLILKLKRKLCRELELKEYFFHPKYFEQSESSLYVSASETSPTEGVLLPVSDVAEALLKRDHKIVTKRTSYGGSFVSIEKLLHFERYHNIGAELLVALYNPQNEHKVIEDPVLDMLAEALRAHWEPIAIALNASQVTIEELRMSDRVTTFKKCLEVFREWSGGKGTYSALRHSLDQYSIFCGRNLLEACSEHEHQVIKEKFKAPETEQQQEPAVESPIEPHHPSSHPSQDLQTDCGINALLEITDGNPLGIESLLEVRTEVTSVMGHSTDLGLALGLRQEPTIHVLQLENQQDIACQFTEIIAAWLRGVDKAGTPSWRSLTKALIAPTVDCPLIAKRIAERHPSGSNELSPVRDTDFQFMDVNASPLDESSVDILAETLVERSHLWFHLGLVFGLSYGRLKEIQLDTLRTKERLVKTLHSWLCLRDQVLQQGQPSWRTLITALTHPLVDEIRLAEELAETHKVHVEESGNTATPVQLSSSDPSHPPPSHSTASST